MFEDHITGPTVVHERWKPKVRWFHPPRWKIFRWAYDIETHVYTNCYPIRIKTELQPVEKNIVIEFEFSGQQPVSPEIDTRVEELLEEWTRYIDGKGDTDGH